MPESIVYIRGHFPSGAVPPVTLQFVKDGKLFLERTDAELQAIADAIRLFPGFLGKRELKEILAPYFPKSEAVRAARFLLSVEERRQDPDFKFEQLETELKRWHDEKESTELSDEQRSKLVFVLSNILGAVPGFAKQAKARSLADRMGQPLEKLEIFCDLRPVFNPTKDTVEGVIPFTTIRLVCTGPDGLPVAFEAVLSARDVDALCQASQDAKKKLLGLRELLKRCELPIPELDLTKQVQDNVAT